VFCTLIWQAITTASKRWATLKALLAGMILGILIFSYFYLWTAAVAWLVCVGCLLLLLRPVERRRTTRVLIITTAPVILALAFYAYLLSFLPPALDRAWVQTLSHRTELLRVPELLGALIFVAVIVGVRQGKISFHEPQVVFAISFALLPFLLFNQQVISGRSIQPFHYELFIANYVVLVGLVMIVRLLQPAIPRRTMLLLMTSCFLWGAVEVNLSFLANYKLALKNEEMVPVLLRLKEQANNDGTLEGLHEHGRTAALVFSQQYGIYTILPTWAPQGSLLAPGNVSFQSLTGGDRKEWLFMHFYYCGRDLVYLRELLNDRTNDPFLTHYARSAIFGPERVVTFLGSDFQPIRQDEIEKEVSAYENFAKSFSRKEAAKRPLTYAVTLADGEFDSSHIDLWYERDTGARVGAYTLYRLKLRQ
jgi:hypothetical protein